MAQRFIICTNGQPASANAPTPDDRNKITRLFEAKEGWQVWHWFSDVWLIVDPFDSTTPRQLSDELRALLGEPKHVLVMKIEGAIGFSGYGPPDGWPWMSTNWGKPQ